MRKKKLTANGDDKQNSMKFVILVKVRNKAGKLVLKTE